MGHSWREMDPFGAAEHDDRMQRIMRLHDSKIMETPLSKFTVGDLGAVYRLALNKTMSEEDIRTLELRLEINE